MSIKFDAVLERAVDKTGLKADGFEMGIEDFLDRQMKTHRDYDLSFRGRGYDVCPHVNLLADKVYLFACLMGKQEVVASQMPFEKVFLERDESLHLLKVMGPQGALWADNNLWRIFSRRAGAVYRSRKNKESKAQSYREILNELGRDGAVVEKWGHGLTYENDIGGMPKHYKKH